MDHGAVSVAYDTTVLDPTSISFAPSLPDDPDFRCPTAGLPTSVGCPPSATFVSFGTLAGLPVGQPVPVATPHFLSFGAGTSDVLLSVTNAFSDVAGSPLPVSLGSTRISAAPEPAVGLLLLPAVAALLWARRGHRPRAWLAGRRLVGRPRSPGGARTSSRGRKGPRVGKPSGPGRGEPSGLAGGCSG